MRHTSAPHPSSLAAVDRTAASSAPDAAADGATTWPQPSSKGRPHGLRTTGELHWSRRSPASLASFHPGRTRHERGLRYPRSRRPWKRPSRLWTYIRCPMTLIHVHARTRQSADSSPRTTQPSDSGRAIGPRAAMQSSRRARRDSSVRGEPAARCPTKAEARHLKSASRRSACASSGRCSRLARPARQLSA